MEKELRWCCMCHTKFHRLKQGYESVAGHPLCSAKCMVKAHQMPLDKMPLHYLPHTLLKPPDFGEPEEITGQMALFGKGE